MTASSPHPTRPPVAAILGASGFLGRQIAEQAVAAGWRVKLGGRNHALAAQRQPLGQPGQSMLCHADFAEPTSLGALAAGSDIVINSTGILFQRGKQRFDLIHHQGPHHLAQAAAKAKVQHFIHISALGAEPNSRSAYLRSKWQGEQKIKQAFPSAQIIRPSLLFSARNVLREGFFARFAGLAKFSPILPLVAGETRFQPLAAEDVAAAVIQLSQEQREGTCWELGGTEIYSFRQLLHWLMARLNKRCWLLPVPLPLAFTIASFAPLMPGAPALTRDQIYALLENNSFLSNTAMKEKRDFAGLGMTPLPLAGAQS